MVLRENIRNDFPCSVVQYSQKHLYSNACIISNIYIITDKIQTSTSSSLHFLNIWLFMHKNILLLIFFI